MTLKKVAEACSLVFDFRQVGKFRTALAYVVCARIPRFEVIHDWQQVAFSTGREICLSSFHLAAAMDAYTTMAGLWQPVKEGALAPLSGRWLLRLQEGLTDVLDQDMF